MGRQGRSSGVSRVAGLRLDIMCQTLTWWLVLDPVMGDNGRLYVGEDTVPAYRDLIRHADLILPNQFEAECVQDRQMTDGHNARGLTDGQVAFGHQDH